MANPPTDRSGRLKVAFAYDHCSPPDSGGAERFYASLAGELASRDVEVAYLTTATAVGGRDCAPTDLRVIAVAGARRSPFGERSVRDALCYALGLFRHLAREGGSYDVVEVASIPPTSVIAAWLGLIRHRETALLVDWHEAWRLGTWLDHSGPFGLIGWFADRIAMRLGLPVAYSQFQAERLPRDSRSVPMIVEGPEAISPKRSRDPDQILCVGRLVADKRLDRLPSLIHRLTQMEPNRLWSAVVVGSGPERLRIEARARALGVADRITFRSGLSRAQLFELMSGSAILFHPTKREGFGIVVAEALACGLPVLLCEGTDNAAVLHLEGNDAGAVVPADDTGAQARALIELTSSDSVARQTALEWWANQAPAHTSERAADRQFAIWVELLETRRHRAG